MSPSSLACRCLDDLHLPQWALQCQHLKPNKGKVHAFIFKLYITLFPIYISVTYLLSVSGPPVFWSWDQCLLVMSLQSSAPWIPFLWPCSGSFHSGYAVLVNLNTHRQQRAVDMKQSLQNSKWIVFDLRAYWLTFAKFSDFYRGKEEISDIDWIFGHRSATVRNAVEHNTLCVL